MWLPRRLTIVEAAQHVNFQETEEMAEQTSHDKGLWDCLWKCCREKHWLNTTRQSEVVNSTFHNKNPDISVINFIINEQVQGQTWMMSGQSLWTKGLCLLSVALRRGEADEYGEKSFWTNKMSELNIWNSPACLQRLLKPTSMDTMKTWIIQDCVDLQLCVWLW